MLEEILEITGNRPIYDALKELLTTQQAIAFVGAGASSGMYPLWGKFIEQLADYAVSQGKAEPKDSERWKADKTSTPQQRVNTIVRKLGEPHYHQFLRNTFAPCFNNDHKRFTPTHTALLRLPFRGYVTTNYDPALEFARMELRPACLTTGTPTWQEDDEVYRWYTGDVFDSPDACPILWLHGYWQRPAGIVLNAGEYANAYKQGLYRNTFTKIWSQDHLVFIGFSFKWTFALCPSSPALFPVRSNGQQ
ncbi:MAG: SIR2 family protein [Armatimonadota bacterium]